MRGSLAESSIECARTLEQLSTLLCDEECEKRSELQRKDVEDQAARFRIWAGNLGAFHRMPDASSLDYRLRDSPKIASQTQELLSDMISTIQDVCAIASGERLNRRSTEQDDDEVDSDDEISSEEVEASSENDEIQDCQATSESHELFESAKDTLASLFRLAVIIRNASPRDRFAKALSGANPFDDCYDILHVGHKFPKLDKTNQNWLKQRLGRAITQRRQFLRYSREHRDKLGKVPKDLWGEGREMNAESRAFGLRKIDYSTDRSQKAVTLGSKPVSTLAPTTASTLLIGEEPTSSADFQDDQSQTSFALSLGEDDEDRLQLPRLADVAKGQASFECPLCWTIQEFRTDGAWFKHALSDLRPYVCTFEECDMKLFSDRREWFDHEIKQHRTEWQCHFCGYKNFSSADQFRHHLQQQHNQGISEVQIDALIEASQRPNECFPASQCPFCTEWEVQLRAQNTNIRAEETVVVTPAQFRRHVASHMRELALFAIPRGYLEGDEDEKISGASVRAADGNEKLSTISTVEERSYSPSDQSQSKGALQRGIIPEDRAGEMFLRIERVMLIQRLWRKRKSASVRTQDVLQHAPERAASMGIIRGDNGPSVTSKTSEKKSESVLKVSLDEGPESRPGISRNGVPGTIVAAGDPPNDSISNSETEKRMTSVMADYLASAVEDLNTGQPSADDPNWITLRTYYPFSDHVEFLEAIKTFLSRHTFNAGKSIIKQSQRVTWVGWLVQGQSRWLRNFNNTNDVYSGPGKETLETKVAFGLDSLLYNISAPDEYIAETDCIVFSLPISRLRRLLDQHPEANANLKRKATMSPDAVRKEKMRIREVYLTTWMAVTRSIQTLRGDHLHYLVRDDVVEDILKTSLDSRLTCNLNISSSKDVRMTALDITALRDDANLARILLHYGAAVTVKTIMNAVSEESLKVLELILDTQDIHTTLEAFLRDAKGLTHPTGVTFDEAFFRLRSSIESPREALLSPKTGLQPLEATEHDKCTDPNCMNCSQRKGEDSEQSSLSALVSHNTGELVSDHIFPVTTQLEDKKIAGNPSSWSDPPIEAVTEFHSTLRKEYKEIINPLWKSLKVRSFSEGAKITGSDDVVPWVGWLLQGRLHVTRKPLQSSLAEQFEKDRYDKIVESPIRIGLDSFMMHMPMFENIVAHTTCHIAFVQCDTFKILLRDNFQLLNRCRQAVVISPDSDLKENLRIEKHFGQTWARIIQDAELGISPEDVLQSSIHPLFTSNLTCMYNGLPASSLHIATMRDDVNVAEILIRCGAIVDDLTILRAVEHRSFRVLEHLLGLEDTQTIIDNFLQRWGHCWHELHGTYEAALLQYKDEIEISKRQHDSSKENTEIPEITFLHVDSD